MVGKHAPVDARDAADLQAAYERGRQDERARRRRHPVLMTLMGLTALAGVILLALAAREGSFARSGVAVDQNLSAAADRAEPAIRNAAADANTALKDAGQSTRQAAHDATK